MTSRQNPNQPLTFDEWKQSIAPNHSNDYVSSLERLHTLDYKKHIDGMMELEYQEYLLDYNSNWLL